MTEKLFKLKQHGTDVRTEIMAGVTTFMTMAYILAVNPSVLSGTGMDSTAVLLATCIASFIGTMFMGLAANLPFALSAGMGLNAFFAYTVVATYGYSWQTALMAVFIEGVIFIVLSLTKIREAIFDCIPLALKKAVSVGIGLFICFIGLQNAGLAVDSSTLVSLVNFKESFSTTGICALLAVIGTLTMAVLYVKKVPGSILIGIIVTWILGILRGNRHLSARPRRRTLYAHTQLPYDRFFQAWKHLRPMLQYGYQRGGSIQFHSCDILLPVR